MKKPFSSFEWEDERQKIIGLGEKSVRKNYYSELQNRQTDIERYNILLNKISDGIFIVNLPNFSIEEINEAAIKLFDLTQQELKKHSFVDLFQDDVKEKFNEAINKEDYKITPYGFSIESELISKTNNLIPVELSVEFRSQNEKFYCVVLVKNISDKKESEDNLWIQTQFKNLIIENAGYAIIATDEKGVITMFNKAAENLLGYKSDELIGKLTPIIFHDIEEVMYRSVEFSNQLHKKVEIGFEVFTAKTNMNLPNEHEWTYITKDRRRKKVLLNVTAVRDKNNNIIGYIGQAMDLTQIRSAEKDLQKIATNISEQTGHEFFNSVVEYLGKTMELDYVIIAKHNLSTESMDTLSVWSDNKVLKNYSYKLEGTPCEKIINDKKELYCDNIQIKFPENESLRKRKIIGYYGIPLFNSDENLIGILVLLKKAKIQDSKRSNSILKIFASRSSSELERILNEEKLISAKEKAEVADKLKSEFLAQMSHEIRTPLNSILNFTDLIKSEIYESSNEDIKTSFGIIGNSGKRLLNTIDSILQMAQIQTGSVDVFPKYIDVNVILEKLYEENRPSATFKKLNLIIQREALDSKIYADEHTVTQLFENIINNAIKYTEEGFVKIISKNDLDNNIIIEITDSGIGISEEYKKELFTAFTQEEQGYTRKYEGNGLGLALVKNYCEINNAQIEVDSKKGSGSTFRVLFNTNKN